MKFKTRQGGAFRLKLRVLEGSHIFSTSKSHIESKSINSLIATLVQYNIVGYCRIDYVQQCAHRISMLPMTLLYNVHDNDDSGARVTWTETKHIYLENATSAPNIQTSCSIHLVEPLHVRGS